jgi:hypothetical protein
MRMSISAGLTLCATVGAGQAHTFAKKPVDAAHRHTMAKSARPAESPTQFRSIPPVTTALRGPRFP